jgi:hypothetical protein
MCGVIPHDRQSPGVGIQATARYIHVHGNPTIRCLVRLQQLLLRPPQHDKSCVLQGRPDLSLERAPPNDRTVTLKKKKRSLVKSSRLGSTPRLTVSYNVTLTLIGSESSWTVIHNQ